MIKHLCVVLAASGLTATSIAQPLSINQHAELPPLNIGGHFQTTFEPDCIHSATRPNNIFLAAQDRPGLTLTNGNSYTSSVPCGKISFVPDPDMPDVPDMPDDMDTRGAGNLIVTGYVAGYTPQTPIPWQLDFPPGSQITVTITYPNLAELENAPGGGAGNFHDQEATSIITLEKADGSFVNWISDSEDYSATLRTRNDNSLDAIFFSGGGNYFGPRLHTFRPVGPSLFLYDSDGTTVDSLAIPRTGEVNRANYDGTISYRVRFRSTTGGPGIDPRLIVTNIEWTY